MTASSWTNKRPTVASLQLDSKNPRLGPESAVRTPRDIIQHLFEYDKAVDLAESIATRGFFPNEPLLAVSEGGKLIVVEGNRRLAALKALRDPSLLDGKHRKAVERLAAKIVGIGALAQVPVIIAPTRRATDPQVAGRHVGTPVLAWEAENRANFILAKLRDGYTTEELKEDLNFSAADIQRARQTKAIADMARSLDLPDKVKAKLENPRAAVFSTLGRVLDSKVGREYLRVVPDADHGIRGVTPKNEFIRGFTKLVTDVATGKQSSRSLNSSEDIRAYFGSWKSSELPGAKRGSFTPDQVIKGGATDREPTAEVDDKGKTPKRESKFVVPKSFHVKHGNDRLVSIRNELAKLDRAKFSNAGAVLLRVFLELSIEHYLKRTGELAKLTDDLKARNKLQPGRGPELKQLIEALKPLYKSKLPSGEAVIIEKALRYDHAAPFSIQELHAFVHTEDMPSPHDIKTFWKRTEPLFRMMLEQE